MASTSTHPNGAPCGVVAVGASAGGVEALTQLAAGLPDDLPSAVLIVLHMPASAPSVLAKIINRSGPLPAVSATDGASVEGGRVYVAVPGRHLLIADHRVVLSEGPTENGHRPAINSLFRSVALSFGPRAVGVLLSGVLDDGVLGAGAIRSRGGTTIAQHPEDALFPAMPLNALQAGVIDHTVAASEVGNLLVKLADQDLKERDSRMELENRIAVGAKYATFVETDPLDPHSGYTCPDCNGSLMAVTEGNYRCRVGHAWTAGSLLKARDDEVEGALWIAVRSLQEKAKLSRKMAENIGGGRTADKYLEMADEAEHAMEILGKRLSESNSGTGERGDT